MKLNERQQKKLIKKLSEVWAKPKSCPVCGQNEWDVSDTIFELREFHDGSMVIGGQSKITPTFTFVTKIVAIHFFSMLLKWV